MGYLKYLLMFIVLSVLFMGSAFAIDNSTDSGSDIRTTDTISISQEQSVSSENAYTDKSNENIIKTEGNKQNISSSSKLNEEVKNTKTGVNHTYVRPKAYVLLNASVLDEDGKTVNEGQVFFKLNNTLLKNTNDTPYLVNVDKGFAQLKYYVGLIPTGDYNFTAVYNGTTNYNTSIAEDTLTVQKNKTMVDVTINPSSVVTGKKMNLTATFTREDNVTVTGGKVVFKLNRITIKDSKGNPIYARLVDGKATIETKIPTGTSASTYIISASYSGTTVNAETRSKEYRFNVLKDNINLSLSEDTYVVKQGEKISISGQILNSENRNTKRSHVTVLKLNNKTVFNWLINDYFSFTIDTLDLKNNE